MTDIQVVKESQARTKAFVQPNNIANMYQDIIMKLQQNQHPQQTRPPGSNPVANLLGAAQSGLPANPNILHQVVLAFIENFIKFSPFFNAFLASAVPRCSA